MLDERFAAHVGAADILALEIAFDHHLGGNARMIGSDHPQSVLAQHPGMAGEHVLKGDVERMANME